MAVPAHYATVKDYLQEVFDFLSTYRWVYSFPNTHILVNKVFDEFPVEWLSFFRKLPNEELNGLSLGDFSDKAPLSLKLFFEKLNKLKCTVQKEKQEDFKFCKNSGMSKKKEAEVISLACLIHHICEKYSCNLVVDVGTGLGYLPRFLYDRYKYRTLAIEGSDEKITLAKIKQAKYPESSDSINYFQHFVTRESAQQLKDAIDDSCTSCACITGLHACADLSVIMLELFMELDVAKSLVIMPCCYHRLKQKETGFENFPVSETLKKMWERYNAGEFLSVSFLRLACQETVDGFSSMTEVQHEEHVNNCLFRAILQDVAESENYQVRRLKRKSGKSKQSSPNVDPFEAYLTNLKSTHTLIGGEITDHQFLEKMREKWMQHKGNAYLIEALAALQAAVQNICENVVLLDRVMFLKEKGVECFVVKVTDQGISPRCHALVAVKP